MAMMIDKKPEYKGEGKLWDSLADNLPGEAIVYNGREVNGREFDFCVLMKNIGMIVIEVKGWIADSIFDVAGVDEIIIQGYDKPEKSPKKQARAYRFGLLNMISDKYNVSPLIFDLVCYPFITKKEYYEKRLDIVSEESLTLFKEDLSDPIRLGDKLLNAYNQCKSIPHAEMDEELMGKIRQHFEPHFQVKKPLELSNQVPYSVAIADAKKMAKKQIHDIVDSYLKGTKTVIFVESEDVADSILYVLEGELNDKGVYAEKNNLRLKKDANNEFSVKSNSFRIFNFELYVVDGLSDFLEESVTIYEGDCTSEERFILEKLSQRTTFNIQQYFIEHASTVKNILVRAGAGTGKTYSMVSRIAFLCNKFENPTVNLIDDIAMVTFTNDAADNMKNRLKQMFINYFVLTSDPKFLKYIEDTDFMRISTIHKFAREIIKEASMQMGLGDNFAITSGDYIKEQIYEKYLNDFIAKKEAENPNFINEIKLPLYQFRRMLVEFSNQLYNKSIDIKKIKEEELGNAPGLLPFFNEIIMEVIIAAEIEYATKIQESNKIDLRETMIVLNDVVNQKDKDKTHLDYKYIFIDEFQDTDDAQIDSFLKIQQLIGKECNLFVVGDLKQSIYRFRGATISAFKRLNATPDRWEEHTINTNYRTDSRLLEVMDEIFQRMGASAWLPYVYDADHLVSNLNGGANEDELFECVPYHGKNDEQLEVLLGLLKREKTKIIELEKTRKLSKEEKTIAILVRENWQIEEIIKGCKELDEEVEIETKVGGDLYQLDSTIDFCKLLMALTNPDDPVCLVNFIESNYIDMPLWYQGLQNEEKHNQTSKLVEALDKYFMARMNKTWNGLVAYVQANPVLMVLKTIFETLQPWNKYSEDLDKQRFYKSNYELLIEKIIKSYSVDYLTLTVIANSIQINILTGQQELARATAEDETGIRFLCTTVHKAKGLEYGTVILPFTGQAIDNLKKANTDVNYSSSKLAYSIKVDENKKDCNSNYDSQEEIGQRICEEARILYVALTRAIRNCIWMKDTDKRSNMSWSKFLEV
ncbi:MAG: UvrD-helicase domain-containing protein [Lachnobacterium sp.]|nr:UvrD-helicase domain-containing protein [Lachnobacterium sp.]